MKFRISMKALLWSWLVIILLMVGLAYNAYDKLRPEAFVQLANEQIKKNIPNSELIVGSVDYSFSIDFNVKLKQVTVVRNEAQLAKIGELELKIPWWLLITHRGTAQVNIGQVEILISSQDVKKIAHNGDSASEKVTSLEFEIPKYLSEAQFTLRAKDVSLKNEDASRTYLQISKLLVREFALQKNSAFEIKLPIWFEHNGLNFNSEVWLFGDLTPDQDKWIFNFTGDFRTKDIDAKVSFDDVALEGSIKLTLPQFVIEAQNTFMIDKEEKGTASFKLDQDVWNLDLDFSSLPLQFLALFEEEILNDYFRKFDGEALGKISLSQKVESEEISLVGNLSFPGNFKYQNLNHEGNWNITFDNNLWITRFEGANIKFSRENLIAFTEGHSVEVKENYEFTDMAFDDVFKFLPALAKVTKPEIPESKTYLLTDVKKEGEVFSGSFDLSSNARAFNYSGHMRSAGEEIKFSFVHDVDYAVDLKLANVKFLKGFDFFSPWISGEGVVNIDFQARELNAFPFGSWKLNGSLDGKELEGILPGYLLQVWKEFERNPQKQQFNLMMNGKSSQFKLVDLENGPTSLEIIFPQNLQSEATATMTTKGKRGKKTVKKMSLGFLQKDS